MGGCSLDWYILVIKSTQPVIALPTSSIVLVILLVLLRNCWSTFPEVSIIFLFSAKSSLKRLRCCFSILSLWSPFSHVGPLSMLLSSLLYCSHAARSKCFVYHRCLHHPYQTNAPFNHHFLLSKVDAVQFQQYFLYLSLNYQFHLSIKELYLLIKKWPWSIPIHPSVTIKMGL